MQKIIVFAAIAALVAGMGAHASECPEFVQKVVNSETVRPLSWGRVGGTIYVSVLAKKGNHGYVFVRPIGESVADRLKSLDWEVSTNRQVADTRQNRGWVLCKERGGPYCRTDVLQTANRQFVEVFEDVYVEEFFDESPPHICHRP